MLEQITASAGSGKTYTLIRRFLELLAASGPEGELALRELAESGRRPHAWPEILAATFTNAAASEMKERLIRELKTYALAEQGNEKNFAFDSAPLFTPDEAQERVSVMLRRFGSINIRTIDSLLTMLVRLSALDFGLPPDFEPVFDDALPTHFELFFDELQERARLADEVSKWEAARRAATAQREESKTLFLDSEPRVPLQEAGGERPAAAELRDLILGCCRAVMADQGQGGFMAPADFTPTVLGLVVHIWEQGELKALVTEEALAAAARALRDETARSTLALRTVIGVEDLECHKNLLNFLEKLAGWSGAEDYSPPPESVYASREQLAGCLNKNSALPSEQAETAFSLWQFAYERATVEMAKLGEARRILPYARLAARLAGPFRDWLAEKGLIPSNLMNGYARDILSRDLGPSEAYCRFGARLEHLLMDEFQDTSRAQWRAIAPLAEECLAGGGKVIYVGDVKQAIYGWRGGDAALFREIATDPALSAMAGEAELTALPANWRSLGRVVELNNTVFAALKDQGAALAAARALLGKDCPAGIVAETARDFRETFGDAAQILPESREGDWKQGHVRLVRLGGQNRDATGTAAGEVLIYYGDEDAEPRSGLDDAADLSGYSDLGERASEVYRHLRSMLLDDILLRRPPGDVAVLTRGNADARLVARWLSAWGVPVLTENSLLLNEHPLVQQIIAFLKFMDNPQDSPALFEFLCSEDIFLPVGGVEAPGLHDWLLGLMDGEKSLLTSFRRDFSQAWERWLAPFYQQAGLMSAYDLTCEMLRYFGVWERRPEDAVFLRRFLELLHGAEEREMRSLPEFLDWWAAPGNAEKLPVAESLDAVRIMTMHKAKGLEFPVVIVPFNDFPIKAAANFQRADLAGGQALLKDRKAFGEAYFRNLSRQAREALHLAYVAWTRAAEELYALLPPEETDDGAGNRRRGAAGVPVSRALDVLLAGMPFDEEGVYETGAPVCENAPLALKITAEGQSRKSGLPALLSMVESARDKTICSSPPPDASGLMAWLPRLKIYRNMHAAQGSAARERGILIHNCLEHLRFAGGGEQEIYEAALRAFMHARRVLNLPRLEEELYQEIMDLLIWVLSLPEAAQWFAGGRPEQEMLAFAGERKVADRLVDTPRGDLILEYKSGGLDLPPAALPLPEHVAQLRGYLALLKAIRGDKPVAGRIVYLDRREVYQVALEEAAL